MENNEFSHDNSPYPEARNIRESGNAIKNGDFGKAANPINVTLTK